MTPSRSTDAASPRWRHTPGQPYQLASGSPVPDGLARRLAGHYADALAVDADAARFRLAGATGPLARLYWTGQVERSLGNRVAALERALPLSGVRTCHRDRLDSHAVGAELRALAAYCDEHAGRSVRDPNYWPPPFDDSEPTVVPWGWTADA